MSPVLREMGGPAGGWLFAVLTVRLRLLPVLVLGSLVVSIALSSCDPLGKADEEKIGVTRAPNGQVEMIVYVCPGNELKTVQLLEVDTKTGGTRAVLWGMTADPPIGSGTHNIPIGGAVPAGFEVTQPLRGSAVPTGIELSATAVGTWGGSAVVFFAKDLGVGDIMSGGGTSPTLSDFVGHASKGCSSPIASPGSTT